MFWLCTNAVINWNAIAAVGTTLAALVALMVWIHSMCAAFSKRKASARLLASLLIPDLEELAVHLKATEEDTWDHASPRSENERENAILFWCAQLENDPASMKTAITKHSSGMRSSRIEQLMEQASVFEPDVMDSMTDLLRKLISLQFLARDLIEHREGDVRAALEAYHSLIKTTGLASIEALRKLYPAAGFNKDSSETALAQFRTERLGAG